MAVTLEKLLTHERAFALTKASPVQRAICRVADGLPLGELACNETVVRTLGGPEAVARLPQKPPKELYLVAAIRSGKSLFAAALGCRTALTIDLSMLGPQEVPRVSVVSVDRDKAHIVKDHLMGALERPDSALKRYLVSERAERVLLRRDDGRLVEIVIAAGRVGGSSLVSRWTIAAIFDEAARMLGKEDGAINFDDMRAATIARLGVLPGAQLAALTSPWISHGPIYNAVQEHWGKPSEHLVVVRATGPEINPEIWTPEACEAERLRPNGAYETDVLGDFADPESGFVTASEVRAATRASPVVLLSERGIEYTAAMDPATSGNAWTLVVIGHWPDPEGNEDRDVYRIAFAHQWQGTATKPLKAREVYAEMAKMLKAYRVTDVYTDRWGGSLIVELADLSGLTVHPSTDTQEDKAEHHTDFRTLMLDGRLELPPVERLAADLKSTKKRRMPGGGVRYEYPLTRDGRHADFAPASVLALARAKDGPTWVHAMNKLRARGGVL